MSTPTLRGIRIPDDEWAEIKARAESQGLSAAKWLRALAKVPSAADCAHSDPPLWVATVLSEVGPVKLYQCAACKLVGVADPGAELEWAG